MAFDSRSTQDRPEKCRLTCRPVSKDWDHGVNAQTTLKAECRFHGRGGEYRVFLTTAVPDMNPDRTIREWLDTGADATDRKRVEETIGRQSDRIGTMSVAPPSAHRERQRTDSRSPARSAVRLRSRSSRTERRRRNPFQDLAKDLDRLRRSSVVGPRGGRRVGVRLSTEPNPARTRHCGHLNDRRCG